MNKKYSLSSKHTVVALALASSFALMPTWAEAAGLGRITVYSGLGQPLRAEVQVSASKEELSGMTAQLAPPESFRQAGVDYASALTQLRFQVEKRGDGAVIKVSSERPINDPFLDFLLELNWPAGRLVREYTFLLDPPEVVGQASRRQAVVEARTVPALPAGTEQGEVRSLPAPATPSRAPSAGGGEGSGERSAQKPAASSTAVAPGPKPDSRSPAAVAGGGFRSEHVVQRGETLRRIATENLPAGVSLEQMLVALYRNNAEAFSGKNMNRLRAGAILRIPEAEEAAAIPEPEARKMFRAQAADWNAYRRKLAGAAETAPVAETEASRAAAGRVGAKVEERIPPAEQGRDQVRISRSSQSAKPGMSEEDQIARDKALNESRERVASLEKNVAELQKLLELKNQSLAEMQRQMDSRAQARNEVAAKQVAPEPVASPVTKPEPLVTQEVARAEPGKDSKSGVEAPAASAKVEPAAASAEEAAAKPDANGETKSGNASESASSASPDPDAKVEAEPKPAPAAPPKPAVKKPVPPPPPVEEPGLLDGIDPLPLAAGGGLIAALAGFLFYRRRKAQAEAEAPLAHNMSDTTSTLGPNSVFQTAGGQSVDTSNTTPPGTDFSQAGPGAIDADDVDPVAEADVYMAYGRDTQAEEILLDALQKDPQRLAIHAKLLEIYANRKSIKQFETLAAEVYAQTGGRGPDWDKVAALGRNLDPANPLYGSTAAAASVSAVAPTATAAGMATATLAGAAASSSFDPDATLVVSAPDAAAALKPAAAPQDPGLAMDFSQPPSSPASSPAVADDPLLDLPVEEDLGMDAGLDFDLGTPSAAAPASAAAAAQASDMMDTLTLGAPGSDGGLDFDLGAQDAGSNSLQDTQVNPEVALEPMEFGLDLPLEMEPTRAPAAQAAAVVAPPEAEPAADKGSLLDFELSLPETVQPATPELQAGEEDDMTRTLVMSQVEPDADMEFDVQLTDSTILGNPAGGGFDLSSIDLDLGVAGADAEAGQPSLESVGEPEAEAVNDPRRDEVNTKLDLAKAYEDMGDLEGARELLNEVLNEGAPDQIALAQASLDRLGA